MSRHPDTVDFPNLQLRDARRRLPSRTRRGSRMSRADLAAAVNARLHDLKIFDADIDADYVGKLELGKHNWIRDARRRAALREVLGVATDADIGLSRIRRSRSDAILESNDTLETTQSDAFSSLGLHSMIGSEATTLAAGLPLLDALTSLANERGWAAVHPLVSQHLSDTAVVPRDATSRSRGLAIVDARWSEFMSRICDNGGFDGSEQWLARAYTSSVQAGNPVLTSFVLMRRSQRALDNGDARSAVTYARQALEGRHLPPRTLALCLTRLAEGLALVGDTECLDLLGAALENITVGSAHPDDVISQHCDYRYVSAVRARCLYLLGEHRESTSIINDIFTDSAPSAPTDAGMWMVYLADGYASTDHQRAAAAGRDALAIARSSGSARITRALLPLAVNLRPHRSDEGVQSFLAEHNAALISVLSV